MTDDNEAQAPVPDRPRGILTKQDRELLIQTAGDKPKNEIRDARYRIRKRVTNSIKDLQLLATYLDDRDRRLVFEDLIEETPAHIVSAYAFLYLGNADLANSEFDQDIDESFEDLVVAAIQRGERIQGHLSDATVEVSINREDPPVDELVEELKSGESTINVFNFVVDSGEIDAALEHLVDERKTLYLWDDREELREGDVEKAREISPATAEHMMRQ